MNRSPETGPRVGSVTRMGEETMIGFGRKQAWLALRDVDPAAVAAPLGLRDLGEVSWRSGLDLAYLTDDRVVLTPPLADPRGAHWTLVAGRWLLRGYPTSDVVALSAALGTEAQLFATYRVSEAHRWVRAVDGVLVRAFGYVGEAGEVTEWRGDPDEAEAAVGLPPIAGTGVDGDTDLVLSEHDVLRVAGAWSVDPTSLAGRLAPGPLRAAAAP